jgi:hypothetical protein
MFWDETHAEGGVTGHGIGKFVKEEDANRKLPFEGGEKG